MSEKSKTVHTMTGKVVSNKMEKTIVVLVVRKVPHPVYGKYIERSSKIFAHDETNQCQEGDVVVIKQSRPLSKKKSWTLVEIIEKAAER